MANSGKKAKKSTRTATAKPVSLKKRTAAKKSAPGKGPKSAVGGAKTAELPQVTPPETADSDTTALARIGQLEADRTNLMAQVAWARAVAQEQQKTLEAERVRSEKLAADLDAQRARIEQLKALSVLDRLLGRHKRI